jgi:integrase
MSLSEVVVRNLKPAEKARKYADSEGLFLFVNPTGTKSWRFRYRYLGKEQELTFGTYPELSLLDARTKRLETRKLLATGKDPLAEKKEVKRIAIQNAKNTFKEIAKEWHELNKDNWSARHGIKILHRLEQHVFPVIGHKPIKEIDALDVLDNIIRVIEKNGHTEMSHRILNYCSAIFRLALLTKRVTYNPLADMRGILKPHKTKHYPTIKISGLPAFMQKLEAYNAPILHKLAIKMLLLTFVRSGELRKAKWEYFNFEKKLWCIPAELMKMRQEHIVPLADQTINLLHEIKKHSGGSEYLFPTRNVIKYPYMNENVINNIIKSKAMGYKGKLVAHGFRSLASTTLNELGVSPDVIEKQLAHEEQNKVRAAYNRAEYLQERTKMMQAWANYVDSIINGKSGGDND